MNLNQVYWSWLIRIYFPLIYLSNLASSTLCRSQECFQLLKCRQAWAGVAAKPAVMVGIRVAERVHMDR